MFEIIWKNNPDPHRCWSLWPQCLRWGQVSQSTNKEVGLGRGFCPRIRAPQMIVYQCLCRALCSWDTALLDRSSRSLFSQEDPYEEAQNSTDVLSWNWKMWPRERQRCKGLLRDSWGILWLKLKTRGQEEGENITDQRNRKLGLTLWEQGSPLSPELP